MKDKKRKVKDKKTNFLCINRYETRATTQALKEMKVELKI